MTSSQRRAVKQLHQAGHDLDSLARLYGVSGKALAGILRSKGRREA